MRFHRSLAVLAFASLFVSCGDHAGSGAAKPGDGTFRVALLSPGPISDNGWNAAAYAGLKRIESELGASVRQVQVKSPSEFEGAFRDFASQGYAIVFGHGFEFCEPALRVGKEFPDTTFVVTSGNVVAKNVSSVRYEIEQPAFLAGMVAARASESGRIGCVGGVEIPPVKSAFEAFERGAHEARTDVRVVTSYVGSWEDVAAAKQAALALIDQGADVLFHDADAAGIGVLNAAEERAVFAIGCNQDQSEVKPSVVIASVVLDVAQSFVNVATDVKSGDKTGRQYDFDAKSGVVRLAFNPRLASRVSAVTRARVEQELKRMTGAGG